MTFYGNQKQKNRFGDPFDLPKCPSATPNSSFSLKKRNKIAITGMNGNYWVYFFLCF